MSNTNATPSQVISARILAYVQAGATIQHAIDSVLGPGTYAIMAGEVYDILNAGK